MGYILVKVELVKFTEFHQEMLIAILGNDEYEAFEETPTGVNAYIKEELFNKQDLDDISLFSNELDFKYTWEKMPDKDWNAEWESNYQYVNIDDKVLIKSDFHEGYPELEYQITINPKMSFGTGHHETTALMIKNIFLLNLEEREVLDIGCGTAVLGILASMRGAKQVLGVDIEEWAYKNALENVGLNNISNMELRLGDASVLKEEEQFDVVLANINRNILENDMGVYAKHLRKGGKLVLSGFYTSDTQVLDPLAQKHGLTMESSISDNDWCSLVYVK